MKPALNKDMQLPFQMTVTLHLLRALFEGLGTRWASLCFFQFSKGVIFTIWLHLIKYYCFH